MFLPWIGLLSEAFLAIFPGRLIALNPQAQRAAWCSAVHSTETAEDQYPIGVRASSGGNAGGELGAGSASGVPNASLWMSTKQQLPILTYVLGKRRATLKAS